MSASIDLPIPVAKWVDLGGKPCSDACFEKRIIQHGKN